MVDLFIKLGKIIFLGALIYFKFSITFYYEFTRIYYRMIRKKATHDSRSDPLFVAICKQPFCIKNINKRFMWSFSANIKLLIVIR